MKKALYTIIFLFVAISMFAQNNYELGNSEQLLDGLSFNYQYQNQTAIHIEFADSQLKYKWILGPNEGKPERTYPYKSRKIDNGIYLVNWHETNLNNFITLIFNFNTNTVASSVIVRYGQEGQYTTFDAGFVTQLKGEISTKE